MKDLDFVPTPLETALRILRFAEFPKGSTVLEPHAGEGDLADALQDLGYNVVCGEFDPQKVEILMQKNYATFSGDFLTTDRSDFGEFDHILMSPPFGSGAYVRHVQQGYALLPVGGVLVSVLPQSLDKKSSKKLDSFKSWLKIKKATREDLPSGSFPDSKTNVQTFLVKLEKSDE